MSEIEKMYENAGIEQTQDTTCGDCEFVNYPEENKPCNACTQYGIKHHPPFTAEKQIELIKFITSLGVCEIENWNDKGFHFAIKRERIYPTMFLSLSNINFEETLADIINNLWQDLTKTEQEEIRKILKG